MPPELSVVIPALNEVDNVAPLVEQVDAAVRAQGVEAELIIVDDGSSDGTDRTLIELAATRSRLQAVGDKMIYTGLVRSRLVRGKDSEPSIVIHRKGPEDTQQLDATQDTELRPGDVIDVALQKKLPETSAPTPKHSGH